jgi:hypothetical protein
MYSALSQVGREAIVEDVLDCTCASIYAAATYKRAAGANIKLAVL